MPELPVSLSAEPLVEYGSGQAFPGKIGRTLDASSPAWPAPKRARKGAPNVVVILFDDVGFGQFSAFGGLCNTPTLERLADRGLKYANFHTTALCTPTRGALMTGRNHHSIGVSAITETSLGYPAHNCFIDFEHGFLPEMLLGAGYNTFCVGKWHLAPPTESTMAGPFHRWPLGRGFERFYGFMGGSTDHWYPDLVYDNHPVPAPAKPEDGYHLNIDLADKAIEFIKDAHTQAPDKPFFLYYALGAGHSPHHVEQAWIDKYRGKFGSGWDDYRARVFERQRELGLVSPSAVLSERDPDVPEWESLSNDAKRMYARQMEVYAAFLEQTDHHVGRVVDFIEQLGELENTIVVVFSDNGASAEGGLHGNVNELTFFNGVTETLEDNLPHLDQWGGPNTYPHYSWGWTSAGNTPYRRWKRETYRGGVADPLIISWPEGIVNGPGVRHQFTHVIDLLPTILEAAGVEPPDILGGIAQSPIHGESFAPSFFDPEGATGRQTQYFEMFGSRSIYHEGWRATCGFPGPSFTEAAKHGRVFGMPLTAEILDDLDRNGWELYRLSDDPTETNNLAEQEPERLAEMIERWYHEAETYGVFPLAAAGASRLLQPRPTLATGQKPQVWFPYGAPVYFGAAPRLYNRPYSITAAVTLHSESDGGIIVTQGSRHGGYALFIKDNRLYHLLNYVGRRRFMARSEPLGLGEMTLRCQFEPTGTPDFRLGQGPPGRSLLFVGDRLVGAGEFLFTTPARFGPVGFSCGYAAFDSVAPDIFTAPYRFSGQISEVTVDVFGEMKGYEEAEFGRLMVEQ